MPRAASLFRAVADSGACKFPFWRGEGVGAPGVYRGLPCRTSTSREWWADVASAALTPREIESKGPSVPPRTRTRARARAHTHMPILQPTLQGGRKSSPRYIYNVRWPKITVVLQATIAPRRNTGGTLLALPYPPPPPAIPFPSILPWSPGIFQRLSRKRSSASLAGSFPT